MLNLNHEISVEYDFCEGENVQVIHGPLAGYEGILIKKKSKTRFGIQLKEINQTILIDIRANLIERKDTYQY